MRRCIRVFTALILCIGIGGSLSAAPLENSVSHAPSAVDARSQLIAAAGKYEHTPYRYGGIDRRGLDCSGLVCLSFQDALGIAVPRSAAALYSWAEKIQIEDAAPGDLVFFKTGSDGTISHVGIFVGNGRFIHSASEGPVTGVMYSSLDERYWARTFAGAGRALPAAGSGASPESGKSAATQEKKSKDQQQKNDSKGSSQILVGIAAAPTWGTFLADSTVIRGAAGHIHLGAQPFRAPIIFGIEARPEWDGMLGVFRVPFTLSLGFGNKWCIFGGPSLSFGDASLSASGESRHYSGGMNWFGAAGIYAAPFAFKFGSSELSPYGELAWQSYFSDGNSKNIGADLAACVRFSTGLRYTWKKNI